MAFIANGRPTNTRDRIKTPLACVVVLSLVCSTFSQSPVYLTKLKESGKTKDAKNLSLVMGGDCDIPRSYSAYISVGKDRKNHLYFWLFPSKQDETTSPQETTSQLVLWLHGGPARSALVGLLWEKGPLEMVTENGVVGCRRSNVSWTDSVSILYVDSPVGTGFSYPENNGYRSSLIDIARDLREFLNQFYEFFPEYKTRQLFIGCEGYAGKFAIHLAYQLHTRGISVKKGVKPKLTGLYLNGPFFASEIQMSSALDLRFSLGHISYRKLLEYRKLVKNFFNKSVIFGSERYTDVYYRLMTSLQIQGLTENFVKKQYLDFSLTDKLVNILRKSLHVEDKNYTFYNYTTAERLVPVYTQSVKDKLAVIMDNYKVLVVSGEFDSLFSPGSVDHALMSSSWSLQESFNSSKRSQWKVGGNLAGYYTYIGKLCRVVVSGAGHSTSYDKPTIVRELMRQFVESGCVDD